MKSISLKLLVYLKVLVYFFDGVFKFFFEPANRVFSPDDNLYPPEIGVQPYGGDYYSKWE